MASYWQPPSQGRKSAAGMHATSGSAQNITDVWSWNLDAEFGELLAAVSACGDDVSLALDTEFPGFLLEEKQTAKRSARYEALRQNCDHLRPIQLGVSVAGSDGRLVGTWCFNLFFDVETDLQTEESIAFLRAAGLDFPRHAREGIKLAAMGRRLAASPLVGPGAKPCWVTFQGWYDFGYILRLITNWRLPPSLDAFEELQAAYFPNRYELKDVLPRGSLDSLLRDFGVERNGKPHTAGSDALATLEVFLQIKKGGLRWLTDGLSEVSTNSSLTFDGGSYLHDTGSSPGSSGSWAPGQVGATSAYMDATDAPLGLQALDELAGTGLGSSRARFANASEWDDAVASAALGEGFWEDTHAGLVPFDAGDVGEGGFWDACDYQDPDHAVLAAVGEGLAAAMLPDSVEQQTRQQAAVQSLLMPGGALTSTTPMRSTAGYGEYCAGTQWHMMNSDGVWLDGSSDMLYAMPQQEQRQYWPSLMHVPAG